MGWAGLNKKKEKEERKGRGMSGSGWIKKEEERNKKEGKERVLGAEMEN